MNLNPTLFYNLIPTVLTMIILVMINIFAYLFIRDGFPAPTKQSLVYKLIASSMFILFGLYVMVFLNSSYGGIYEDLIMTGLFVSLFGDFFWSADAFMENHSNHAKEIAYGIGGVFYVSANMCYTVAFLKAAVSEGWHLDLMFFVVLLLLFAVLMVGKQLLGVKLTRQPVAVLLYALMLCLLVTAGGTLSLHQNEYGVASLALLGGSLLYLLSNICSGLKFLHPERYDNLLIRAVQVMSYYVAQILIATTMAFVVV